MMVVGENSSSLAAALELLLLLLVILVLLFLPWLAVITLDWRGVSVEPDKLGPRLAALDDEMTELTTLVARLFGAEEACGMADFRGENLVLDLLLVLALLLPNNMLSRLWFLLIIAGFPLTGWHMVAWLTPGDGSFVLQLPILAVELFATDWSPLRPLVTD